MSESEYDPIQKNRRLWNDSESIMSDSMAGIVMMHRNLVYFDNCKAVLRRDYNKMNEKVRIIGGGSLIDGPMYAGFVGPGMLTAVVLGLPENSDPGIPSTDSIFDVIQHVAKDEQQKMNEVLVLVHDCLEYFLNFMEAKKKAEEVKIPIKLLFVRDEVNFKLSQKPSSPRSPSGLLLLYKIAGAMSEEGRTLNEIYHTCDEIMKDGIISSIGLYIEESYKEVSQVQICRGDRLSDRDSHRFSVSGSTTKKVVETLMTDLINGNEYHKFPKESQLVVMLDYFGGFTELEASIVMKEFLQLSNRYKYKIELILTGSFHTSMEVNGFHLSIFNISFNPEFLYYLKIPTVAFSWPKTSIREIHSPSEKKSTKNHLKEELDYHQNENQIQIVMVESTSHQNGDQREFSPEKPSNSQSRDETKISDPEEENLTEAQIIETGILLTAVEYACDALIACAHTIDAFDASTPQNFEKCGTRLARIASEIKSAIIGKQFDNTSSCNIIFKIAIIIEQSLPDPQAELYSIFFNVVGQSLEDQENLKSKHWLEAFIAANNSIDEFTGGSRISDALYAATTAFCETYAKFNDDVLYPLSVAVSAVQNETSSVNMENISDPNFMERAFCGISGAHALGVWMRGAYEGLKLKCSRSKTRQKRFREEDDEDEAKDLERATKIKKVLLDDSDESDLDKDEGDYDDDDDDGDDDSGDKEEINEVDDDDNEEKAGSDDGGDNDDSDLDIYEDL